ncbi:MAG: YceI family protein [Polyangiaceae bacterium]|jgi:polyisoprenoid-binding protein YceI|nr:YceI family protein [Polyangiaceae bacterium]
MTITRRKLALTLFLVTALFAITAWAAPAKHGPSAVAFSATATGGLKIRGTTSELAVNGDNSQIRITVPLAGLDTGIGLRNKHMRKYLETEKYPNAVLVVEKSALKIPSDGGESSGSASGTLTLHGQTMPITFKYNSKRGGDRYNVAGAASIDIRSFGIAVPNYLGISVRPNVDIDAKFGIKGL